MRTQLILESPVMCQLGSKRGGDILGTPMFANKIHGTKVYLPIDECLIF